MADYSISAEITADSSKFNKGVNNAEKSLKSFSKGLADNINKLGKNGLVGAMANVSLATGGVALALGAVVKVAKKVGQAVSECTQAYRVQYQAELALETAVKNNPYIDGTASNRLKAFASEMQSVTDIGDEQFLPMMAQLIATGRTEAETMDIIRVATDMSATGTMSFETAIQQLNGTINGNIGRLGMQNAELKNLTQEELKSGKAVEILGEKFKGLASATADTSKQLKNAIGDLKENLGKIFETALAPMRKFFTEVITNLNNSITKSRELKGAIKEVFTDDGINVDASTSSMQIAFNKVLEQQREVTKNYAQYLSLYGEYIDEATDETARAYREQISDLNRQIKQLAEELNKRKRESDAEAKKRAEAEKQAETEKTINDLKEKYLKLIAEQEAKWENIKTVTDKAVSNEEKLKFYQEQLVAIMSESNGQITENNQYYKDQMEIIDRIKKLLGGVAEETDDIGNGLEVTQTDFEKFFENLQAMSNDWGGVISNVANTMSNVFSETFTQIGQDLVEGGGSWENYVAIAVKGIAQILQGLASQLTAIAVTNFALGNYAKGATALAGASVALVASGVLTAVADGMTRIKEETEKANKTLEDFQKALEGIKNAFQNKPSQLKGVLDTAQKELNSISSALKENTSQLAQAEREYAEAEAEYNAHLWDVIANEEAGKASIERLENYKEAKKRLEELREENEGLIEAQKEAQAILDNSTKDVLNSLEAENEEILAVTSSYQMLYENAKELEPKTSFQEYLDSFLFMSKGVTHSFSSFVIHSFDVLAEKSTELKILIEEQMTSINKTYQDLVLSLSKTGNKIGTTITDSIINGATKKDFLSSMKDYIRTNLIQLAVYTESFRNKLSEVGTKLSIALMTGGDFESIKMVREELESLWEEASSNASRAEEIISTVFGDIKEDVEETTETVTEGIEVVEEQLTRFELAMGSFQNTVSDLGGDIASNLVEGLSNGLNQSDFLSSMKQWIKKVLVQSVVYTNSMKAEIEAIGKAITKGITEGFTEDSFHEIRRDLSFIFDQANRTVEGIDNVLNSVFGGGYAIGTDNATRGLHLVGEAGPELVRFRGGEQVLNAGRTQKALAGGNSNTFNVNFTNVKDTSAYALVSQLKQYNRTMAINGVL